MGPFSFLILWWNVILIWKLQDLWLNFWIMSWDKHNPLPLPWTHYHPCSLSLSLCVFLSFCPLALKHPLTPFNALLCSAQPQSNSAKNSIVTSPKGNVPSPALVFTSLFLSVLSLHLLVWLVCRVGLLLLSHTCLSVSASGPPQATCHRRCVSVSGLNLHLCHRKHVNVIVNNSIIQIWGILMLRASFSFMYSQRCVWSVHERCFGHLCAFHCLDQWQANQTLAFYVQTLIITVMNVAWNISVCVWMFFFI